MTHPNIRFSFEQADGEYDEFVVRMPVPRGDHSDVVSRLTAWWLRTSAVDLLDCLPKAHEYGGSTGSADLELVGSNIAHLMGWEDVPTEVLQEIGCWFYLQGKIARLISDYQQRRPGKPDTLKDAATYTMMMRRLQEAGRWP